MPCIILITICLTLTLCAGDPNILQGLPHGVRSITSGSHHHDNSIHNTFPSFSRDNTAASNNQQHSFQQETNFNRGNFPNDHKSPNLRQNFNQVFQRSTTGPVILQPIQENIIHHNNGDFQGNQAFQGTTTPIILNRPIIPGNVLDNNFQNNRIFQGIQDNLQTEQNIFVNRNMFVQQQVLTSTLTIDRYVTTTDLVFNSLPVTFTNFVKRTVTRTTRQILPTPVNDVVHLTTAVVSSTSTVTFTHVNTIFTCVTQTTVDLHPITHTSYNIIPTTYTSVITKRLPISSTIVHTNILTDTITVTDRRYVTDYQHISANYY
ncbi:uncharacterized protein [Panulirus ornatus]|uniref:uncharacterized protein n=1 Tax=Panulirus ornatus TaxID=150431 RepID=UPI003A84AEC1